MKSLSGKPLFEMQIQLDLFRSSEYDQSLDYIRPYLHAILNDASIQELGLYQILILPNIWPPDIRPIILPCTG